MGITMAVVGIAASLGATYFVMKEMNKTTEDALAATKTCAPLVTYRTSRQRGAAANAARMSPTWEYACGKFPESWRWTVS